MIAGLILMIAGLLADFLASGLAWFQLMLDLNHETELKLLTSAIEIKLNESIRIKKPEAKARITPTI